MLELKDVHKTFLKGSKALDGVNLAIGPGEIVGLFGENGAGKQLPAGRNVDISDELMSRLTNYFGKERVKVVVHFIAG